MDEKRKQDVRESDAQEIGDQELEQAAGAGEKREWECKKCGCTSYTKFTKAVRGVNGLPFPMLMRRCNQCQTETSALL